MHRPRVAVLHTQPREHISLTRAEFMTAHDYGEDGMRYDAFGSKMECYHIPKRITCQRWAACACFGVACGMLVFLLQCACNSRHPRPAAVDVPAADGSAVAAASGPGHRHELPRLLGSREVPPVEGGAGEAAREVRSVRALPRDFTGLQCKCPCGHRNVCIALSRQSQVYA